MALTTTPTLDLDLVVQGSITLAGAEISAFDPATDRVFVTSNSGLQIVSIANPASPTLVSTIDFTAPGFGFTNIVTSVAVKNGIVAVAVAADPKTDPGKVFLLDASGNLLKAVTVGALPDMLTFTPDGKSILVANEGEATGPDDIVNPDGSISIIDLSAGAAGATVRTATFTAFESQIDELRAAGVRIQQGSTVAQDAEPEYIAVSPDGKTALVTLQEMNAVATLDIATATVTGIVPLGLKNWNGIPIDTSDRDGAGNSALVNLQTDQPIFGMYMPDAIASFTGADGKVYYVIANEGDDRDDFLETAETIRVGSKNYDLDDTLFPNEAALKSNAELGRLTVSNAPGLRGDTDGDGDIDQILAYGARSFSILDAAGNMVFDSAGHVEQALAQLTPELFNADNGDPDDFDTRSDNKGPEPEGVTVGTINGKTYAFVGLERAGGGVMVYDVTDPANVSFTQYARNDGDVSPEGLTFISAFDSPTGEELLAVTNEVSNTLTLYAVTSEVDFTLQLLHFADAEAGLLASQTAPNLAALVDAFDDDYANTIILAGGDNFLPGPFINAGTDPSAQAVHGRGANLGAADIQIHNIIGVEASTIGNHEFDLGTREFRDAILDAKFPYLSANLDFSKDGELAGLYTETVGTGGLEEASALKSRLVPSAVITENGEKIGLVGVTTQILESISSTGGVEVKGFAGDGTETNDIALLAQQLQPVIDDLREQGVNKIVLMAHLQQITFEQQLAPLLEGVDIILAAGSNTRLGDADDEAVAFPGHAADFANTYPIVTAGADGKPTLIVNTDNEYTYLGRLVVDFDENGEIIVSNLAGMTDVNGAYAATTANVAEAWGVTEDELDTTAFADGTKGGAVKDITKAVQAVINTKDGNVFGFTDVYLEGERAIVRNQETNLGNLTSDANKYVAQQALGQSAYVVSFKNGGGIRAQIGSVDFVTGDKLPPVANPLADKPEGGVSELDIENSLRFNNILMVFDTTPEGLKAILEHGVAVYGNQGRFPQIGGIRFSYDTDQPAGSRISDIALIDENDQVIARLYDDGALVADPTTVITVSTLNFLAGNTDAPNGNETGGDGYPIRANGTNFRYIKSDGTLSAPVDETLNFTNPTVIANAVGAGNTALGEQTALQRYMQAFYATEATAFDEADTPIDQDTRIQNLNFREDTVFAADPIFGDAGNNVLNGTAGDETINGGAGNDVIKAGDGDDVVIGGAGNDTMDGGKGDDTFIIGLGDATPAALASQGGQGKLLDLLRRLDGDGRDTYDGGSGSDTLDLSSSARAVVLDLRDGVTTYDRDTIKNIENLIGTDKNDQLGGNAEANILYGGAGNDRLGGEGGDDQLFGGDGKDVLTGGRGADFLSGGAGNDRFVFTSVADIGMGIGTHDIIADFAKGDLIDLGAIDASSLRRGNQRFEFIGEEDFTGKAGQLNYVTDGTSTIVQGDVNGDRKADFQLELTGVFQFNASDFLL